jgi:hypothetical protein
MLRLVLLVVYLVASSFTFHQTKGGGSADPLGINSPPPPPEVEGRGSVDPLG